MKIKSFAILLTAAFISWANLANAQTPTPPPPSNQPLGPTSLIDHSQTISPDIERNIIKDINKLERAARYDYGHPFPLVFFDNYSPDRLIKIGTPAIPYIIEAAIKSQYPRVRRLNAMRVLGDMAYERHIDVVEPLCKILEQWIGDAIMAKEFPIPDLTEYLGRIDDPRVVPCLVQAIERFKSAADAEYIYRIHSDSQKNLESCMDAIAKIGGKGSSEMLDNYSKSSSPSIRSSANMAIAGLNERYIDQIKYIRGVLANETDKHVIERYNSYIDVCEYMVHEGY